MKNLPQAGHPLLPASVALLLLNDWLLKPTFHNALTGKLSDFAGLFALPYLLGVLWPRRAARTHLLLALAFVFWKTPYSQPLIDLLNGLGLGVGRTVDATDNVALLAVAGSYLALRQELRLRLKPLAQRALLVVAGAACLADTLPRGATKKFVAIDKSYSFNFSKRELIARFNQAQIEAVQKLGRWNGAVDFDAERGIFYCPASRMARDTAGAWREYLTRDTLAVLLDYTKVSNQDTIRFRSSFAEIKISGDTHQSKLTLLSIYKSWIFVNKKDYRAMAIEGFEKELIKPMEKNGKRYHKWYGKRYK